MSIKELTDFSSYEDAPPSLVSTVARACVLYSEQLLPQLGSVVLPTEVCRLLVETYQATGASWGGQRKRFFAAIRDASGRSPWAFPGDPLVFPVSPTGHPDKVCLDYGDCNVESTPLLSREVASRVSGLVCQSGRNLQPELRLSKLVCLRYERRTVAPSTELVHLELHQFSKNCVKLLGYFPNLVWLSVPCLKLKESPVDLTPLLGLHKLRHLDVQRFGVIRDAKDTFSKLLTEMPDLEYLDISETNLDEGGLPGLFRLRQSKPLKFLGLYKTTHDGCKLLDLPAEVVSGTANAEQRAAALEFCSDLCQPWEIIDTISCWKTQFNYIVQLLQMWIRKRQCGFRDYVDKILGCLLIRHHNEIPHKVNRVVYDVLVDYTHQDRTYHVVSRSPFLQSLVDMVWRKLGSAKVNNIWTSTHNHLPLARLVGLFINYWWSRVYDDVFCEVVKALDSRVFCHSVDVSDEASIRIVDVLNCQFKNLICYLESVNPDRCIMDEDRDTSFVVTKKVYEFVVTIFDQVDHPSIIKCKNLFSYIKQWEVCYRDTDLNPFQ